MNRYTPIHDHKRIADRALLLFVLICAFAPLLRWIGALK